MSAILCFASACFLLSSSSWNLQMVNSSLPLWLALEDPPTAVKIECTYTSFLKIQRASASYNAFDQPY